MPRRSLLHPPFLLQPLIVPFPKLESEGAAMETSLNHFVEYDLDGISSVAAVAESLLANERLAKEAALLRSENGMDRPCSCP